MAVFLIYLGVLLGILNSAYSNESSTPLNPTEIDYEVPLTPGDLEWLGTLLELPKQGEVRIRKEYRQVTDEDRDNFHKAVNLLKDDKNVSLNKFDLLGNVHARYSTAAAAHNGPSFLGWHRVFLLMMENALRQKIPTVTIPYWDTTIDDGMKQPYYSIIWSEKFMGSGGGTIKIGPFKNWTTPHGLGKLRRMTSAQGKLMKSKDIGRIMKQKHLNGISFPNADLKNNIEEIHNRAHQWVGGQMRKIEHSAFDPSFYVLHSFVDLLWEEFRNSQKQNGIDPSTDYPGTYGVDAHSPLAPMGLGNLVVIDGLNDIWMEGILYAKRPKCNASSPDCGSKYLKCHKKRARCISYTYQEYEKLTKSSEKSENSNKKQEVFTTNSSGNTSNIMKKLEKRPRKKLKANKNVTEKDQNKRVTTQFKEGNPITTTSITKPMALLSGVVNNSDQQALTRPKKAGQMLSTKSRLPSVFELYGLRWWLFQRDEKSVFKFNPIDFWHVLQWKSKTAMSNLINTLKIEKEDIKISKTQTEFNIERRDYVTTQNTNTGSLTSSASVVVQSASFISLTVLILFYNW